MSEKRKADEELDGSEAKKPQLEEEEKKEPDAADSSGDAKPLVQGPEHAGTLVVCGQFNWDMVGKRDSKQAAPAVPQGRTLWSPHIFGPLKDVRVRVATSGGCSGHNVIVTEDGKCFTFGRNVKGQLGLGDEERRDIPTLVESLKGEKIVGAACGRHHTLFLTDRGEVYSAGDNKCGQCGVGNTNPVLTATKIKHQGAPIVKVSCGAEFSAILDCRGVLFTFGLPEYGQLGHNTDGKYFITSTKLGFNNETKPKRILMYIEKQGRDNHSTPVDDVDIQDVACGVNHTVAVDSKGRVFSWGFGGYGRLGHAETKDEMVPRRIKYFDTQTRGIKKVFAGSTYSLALAENGNVFSWGMTKRTGEANMYPKPVQDLCGWDVRSIGCSVTSVMVAADESVIGWGCSPTYGELGLGETKKSSANPTEVKLMDGIHVHAIEMGMGHTLMICRDESEQDKANLADLPVYNI
ncbi:protein RCC2 homolog [Neocloeon triangulifer]|uniref:protein RCC2 homolog n=1 Tax=Neocloeon triangulifer TaxID=2078957 RepID=UPI00286F06E7|nr:protein RCC2 homolog [Neocloeon triangulifer]